MLVIIGQKTLREKLGIDVMAQLTASVLKAQGHPDGVVMELTARYVGEPNDGCCASSGNGCRSVRAGR